MRHFVFLISAFLLSACMHETPSTALRGIASLPTPHDLEGIWYLQGSNSVRGAYTGELELRSAHDGTYNAVRIIDYISFYHQGLRVQELWTGKAVQNEKNLVITYDLKAADFITQVDDQKRPPEDFKKVVTLNEFFQTTEKNYLEAALTDRYDTTYKEWLTTKRNLEAQPLWKKERMVLAENGQPFTDPSNRRLAATSKNTSFKIVFDTTNYEFYKTNLEKLRVVNKPLDTISLTESLFRRNAYAFSLSQKAKYYDEALPTAKFNLQGLINGSPAQTSFYVSAEAFRYLKTHKIEALANMQKSLQALFVYLNLPSSSPTRSDLQVITHAFLLASQALPAEDTANRAQLKLIVKKAMDSPSLKAQPLASILGLAAYLNQDSGLKENFKNLLNPLRFMASIANKKKSHLTPPKDSIPGLLAIDTMSSAFLADLLGLRELHDQLCTSLMTEWSRSPGLFRQLLTPLAYSVSDKTITLDPTFANALEMFAWSLREAPFMTTGFDVSYDLSLSQETSSSSAKKVKALTDYPSFEDLVTQDSTFNGEALFNYKGSLAKTRTPSGVNYLYAYWLGQYSGSLKN